MRVAVVGAGPSGLAAARALRELGCEVVVYEAAPDVGGVWSATRAYPGIATQNDKYTYAFSDLAVPDDAALAPTGEQMRRYLADFAEVNGLLPALRLSTRVVAAHPADGGWAFEAHGPEEVTSEQVDWLVVANGLSSKSYVPELAGREDFERAGGLVVSPSDLGAAAVLHDRHVVVIGWGKSAGDIATGAAGTARSVTVVARRIGWKLPRVIRGVSFQRVMLSRLGDFLLWGANPSLPGRIVRKLSQPVRRLLVLLLGAVVIRQQQLRRRGLVPDVHADQLDHLITEGFLEAIDDGAVTVRRGRRVAAVEVSTSADGPATGMARLDDGSTLPADVIVAATGYDQDLDLFTPEARAALLDEHGDLALIRYTLPAGVPGLAFIGWVNSFRNPINAEIQALWLGAMMLGVAEVSPRARQNPMVFRLTHDAATARHLPQLPANGSFLTVDQWLSDIGLRVPRWRRRRELLGPMIPGVYADRLGVLKQRIGHRDPDPDDRIDLTPAVVPPPA